MGRKARTFSPPSRHGSWVWEAVRSLVSDSSATPRPKAGSAGRSGADGSQWVNTLANLCGKGGGAQVRRRSRVRRRCGTWVPLGWGVERPAARRTGSNRGRVARLFPAKGKSQESYNSLHQEELHENTRINSSTRRIFSEQWQAFHSLPIQSYPCVNSVRKSLTFGTASAVRPEPSVFNIINSS